MSLMLPINPGHRNLSVPSPQLSITCEHIALRSTSKLSSSTARNALFFVPQSRRQGGVRKEKRDQEP